MPARLLTMISMAEKNQSRKKDAYTIVLENIHSDFRVFGEGLTLVRSEVKGHTTMLQVMKEDLEMLKADVALIRHNQVTRDEFKFLETRVARLERTVK